MVEGGVLAAGAESDDLLARVEQTPCDRKTHVGQPDKPDVGHGRLLLADHRPGFDGNSRRDCHCAIKRIVFSLHVN
jgi:hypothetical protein